MNDIPVKLEAYPMKYTDVLYQHTTDDGQELWGFRVMDGDMLSYEASGFATAREAYDRYIKLLVECGWE